MRNGGLMRMAEEQTFTEAQRLSALARQEAGVLMAKLDKMDLSDLAFEEKKKMADDEGWESRVLNTDDIQQFAKGLLRYIDDLAIRRRVATWPAYLAGYRETARLIVDLSLQTGTVDAISKNLRALKNTVDELTKRTNADDLSYVRGLAHDALTTYETAKDDPIIANAYDNIARAYASDEALTLAEWQALIEAFAVKLPEFRRTTRAYLFDVVDALHGQVAQYHLEHDHQIVTFLQRFDMLAYTAARPADFLPIMAQLDSIQVKIAEQLIATALVDKIRAYASQILENLANTGLPLEAVSEAVLAQIEAMLKRADLSHDELAQIVRDLQKIKIAP